MVKNKIKTLLFHFFIKKWNIHKNKDGERNRKAL